MSILDLHTFGWPEPFEDEIHPRLRFVHRGLVGMANNGAKNSNDSQFFITLGKRLRLLVLKTRRNYCRFVDRADELNGKHTLFGRVIGDTFFSKFGLPSYLHQSNYSKDVLKIGEMGKHNFFLPINMAT